MKIQRSNRDLRWDALRTASHQSRVIDIVAVADTGSTADELHAELAYDISLNATYDNHDTENLTIYLTVQRQPTGTWLVSQFKVSQ